MGGVSDLGKAIKPFSGLIGAISPIAGLAGSLLGSDSSSAPSLPAPVAAPEPPAPLTSSAPDIEPEMAIQQDRKRAQAAKRKREGAQKQLISLDNSTLTRSIIGK